MVLALTLLLALAPTALAWALTRREGLGRLGLALVAAGLLAGLLYLGLDALVEARLAWHRQDWQQRGGPIDWTSLDRSAQRAVLDEVRRLEARGKVMHDLRGAAPWMSLGALAALCCQRLYRHRLRGPKVAP